VEGFEDFIAIERKSASDFARLHRGATRTVRAELERMRAIPYAALVIEASLAEVLTGCGGLHPNSVIGTIAAWTMRYRLPILFADNRKLAETLTARLLVKAAKYAGLPRGE
jgi:ERCC4-type nuclease